MESKKVYLPIKRKKLVIVGNGGTGKTCVLFRFRDQKFPEEEMVPTVMDNYFTTIQLDGVHYEIELWDTAGQEQFDRLQKIFKNVSKSMKILNHSNFF